MTIAIITDKQESNLIVREASRVIMFNDENKIALTYTSKHGHHKLPGGGVEDGETWKESALREAIEETGYQIKLRENGYIGKIIEDRTENDFIQISHCSTADVIKKISETQLTDSEIADGYIQNALWVTLQEAIELFNKDNPKTNLGRHMHARDKKFIEQALKD